MGRGVRPTEAAEIERLSDAGLAAYIAETKRRIQAMTNAALRNDYQRQLRLAERISTERSVQTHR